MHAHRADDVIVCAVRDASRLRRRSKIWLHAYPSNDKNIKQDGEKNKVPSAGHLVWDTIEISDTKTDAELGH